VTWGKTPKHESESPGGVNLFELPDVAPVFWKTFVKDKPIAEPALPKGKVSTGVIVVEDDGRIWIIEPAGHYGGYQRTFPKGQLEPDLTGQQNALKELWEETGLFGEITGYVGDFQGTTGVSRYYLAKRKGGAPWASGPETATVSLLPMSDAADLLLGCLWGDIVGRDGIIVYDRAFRGRRRNVDPGRTRDLRQGHLDRLSSGEADLHGRPMVGGFSLGSLFFGRRSRFLLRGRLDHSRLGRQFDL